MLFMCLTCATKVVTAGLHDGYWGGWAGIKKASRFAPCREIIYFNGGHCKEPKDVILEAFGLAKG